MNSVQVHLALTHVPVILSIIGLILLIIVFFTKNATLTKTAYIMLLIAGVAAIPVFLTGEGTEEAVENLPGVSEAIIESHEEIAKLALISISIAGLVALAALFASRWQKAAGILKVMLLLVAISSTGLMVQTAHLGGQIRHTEIREGFALQNGNENNAGNENNQQQEIEED